MSLDDRDWYRDLMRERAGLKPKWQLWKLKASQKNPLIRPLAELMDGSFVRKPLRLWHPVLLILVFAVICIFTFALLKILLPK
jgi:hypothetical protein